MSAVVRLVPSNFPTGIKDLPEPPEELFLTGQLPAGPRVALVGTRRPTKDALKYTEQLALELSEAGAVIVSGGAVGIDTAAHEGALKAGAGTLVVAPSSYCCPYPEENRELFRRIIASGGGHLTLAREGTKAQRHAFFSRNGLLVSLCSTVILIQAPHRSGARNATLWARKLHRPYWVVPHPPWCPAGAASASELRLGGKPLAGARDIVTWLAARNEHAVPLSPETRTAGERASFEARISTAREPTPVGQDPNTSDPHRDVCRLVAALKSGPRHPDELCEALGWPPARLQSTLLHATLLGELERLATGQIARVGDSRCVGPSDSTLDRTRAKRA